MTKKLMMMFAAIAASLCAGAETINVSVTFDAISSGDATIRTGTVTWKNTDSDGTASPYVRVSAGDGALIRFSDADAWGKSIEFLATSKTAPASKLKVNETGSLQFLCMTDSDDRTLELSWTQGNDEAFPWSDIGPSLKPSYVDDTAWTFALATLKLRFGTTWNSYLSRLRDDADSLAGCGRPVNRLDRLLQVEINAALGVDAVLPVLASVTDAARSARGLGLSFARSYSSAMYGRFNKGILGYGWTDNLSTYAELSGDKNTLVFRTPGGGSYAFTKATGSWQPEDARDKSVLAESSSAYTLTYQSGTVQTFAKSNMRTASIADNSGNKLTFTWSGTTLQNIAHTDGQSLTFGYSGGLLASVTDDYGRETRYTYSDSLLTKVTAPDGLETLYEYRAADGTAVARALSRITYFDGTTREYSYDTSNGLVSAVSVNGGKEKTTISRNGLNVTLTGPDGAATTVSMGVSGETLKTTDALGGVATNGYTEDGLLKSVVSPTGLTGSISHDALGRVSKSVSANGAETAFAYEETFGNLKTVTDANGHAVTYGYDEQGRGKSVTFADGSSSTIEYNDRGDVLKSTNRRGQSISYEYDSQGRIKKKTWSNGRTFTYEYDAHDNVTQAVDSETGTVAMEYDPADRLKRIEYPKGRGFTFSYDSAGRLATRTSLDGVAEEFAYDASGRLASVADGNGNFYLKNTYDATTGRLLKQENGNGTSVSYLYDKLGRVVSIEHRGADGNIAESLQYCYDADGRCIRAASLFGEERYTYDKDGQLTAVDYPEIEDETFAYDAVGNRKTANGATYSVNNLNQYTAVSGGANPVSAITYDRDGNLTSLTDADGTTTYTYDTLNRLVAVKNAAAGIDWSCTYDVFGNRVSVTDNGVTTERIYLQGSLPSVAAEYVNGELKERHIVVGAVRLASLATLNSQLTTSYYHADLIGSTRLVTDGSGAIVDRRAYKAFGETREETDTTATAGYVGTLGVETDSTGLLFMRNRYYSPALGRFIQMDPIGLNGEDVNLYRYCGNETYNSIDPIGCVPDEIIDKSRSGVVGTGIGVTGEIANHPGRLIQYLYGDGIHKVREIGGGGLSLSGRANANATIITKSASVLKTSASVAGAGMSAYDSWNKIQAGDPTGFLISYGKGVASFVPFVNKLVLAWDVGMLLGEGAAWIHYNVINNISANKVLSALHVPSLQTAISIIVSSGEDPGTDDDPGGSGSGEIPTSVEISVPIKKDGDKTGISSKTVTVNGSFTVSFEAKMSPYNKIGQAGSCVAFYVDGVRKCETLGQSWVKHSINVSGEGDHVLEWRVKGVFKTDDLFLKDQPIIGYVQNIEITRSAKSANSTKAVPYADVVKYSLKGEGMVSSMKASVVSNGNSAFPRLYCYERYVVVKGSAYAFELSADDGATISVSGLPSGFSFANGEIYGRASAVGETLVTMTARNSSGTETRAVPFIVIDAPKDFGQFVSYLVVFNANGGSCDTMAKTVRSGTAIGDLPVPTKSGSVFDGWYTAASGGTKVAESTKVTADATYYAHWTDNGPGGDSPDDARCMVTFNLNGGGRSSVRFVSVGSTVGALSTPSRAGYVFEGWFTAARGGTKITSETKVTEDVTFYAHWAENAKPNLAVKSLSACRQTVYIGETFHLRYTVGNSGDAVSAASTITISDGNKRYSNSLSCESLAVGAERDYRLNIGSSALGVGSHAITVAVDAAGKITESSEYDNSKIIYLRVLQLPNTSTTVDWQFHAKSGSPAAAYLTKSASSKTPTTTFKEGESIYIQINFWNALKGDTTGEIRAAALLDTGYGTQWSWTSLGGGTVAYISDSARLPDALQKLKPGTYTLEILLDNAQFHGGTYVWYEANKVNNAMTIEFTVLASGGGKSGGGSVPGKGAADSYGLYGSIGGSVPGLAASVYNGYLYHKTTGALAGTIQIKVGKPNAKTGLASVKATVVVGATKKSLKGADKGKAVLSADGPTELELVGGEACEIVLGAEGLSGTYGSYEIDGARNFFASKDKAEQGAANALLGKWLGGVSILADAGNFTVTISAKGKAKVSGTLANGKKATGSAVFLVGEEWACVPVVLPKANISFALWLPLDGGEVVVNGLGDDVVAGRGGALKAGSEFCIDADEFAAVTGIAALPYLPDGVSVEPNGAKWMVAGGAKAGKVAYRRGTQEIDEAKLGDNPSGLKLAYKKADGSFKGSFKVYAEVKGKLKATTVSVSGIVLNGIGYGTATVKGKGGVAVTIE